MHRDKRCMRSEVTRVVHPHTASDVANQGTGTLADALIRPLVCETFVLFDSSKDSLE